MPTATVSREQLKRIAFVNLGGLGDEILFAPVIEAVHQAIPTAQKTLILERRSQAIAPLLIGLNHVATLELQGQSKLVSFYRLWKALRTQKFDAVISSGSNPLIAVLLFLSGIPVRLGFASGKPTGKLLSAEAPLAPKHDRRGYAADMYFALARSFLHLLNPTVSEIPATVIPRLATPAETDLHWAAALLQQATPPEQTGKRILLHPGVSAVSIQKNIIKSWPASSWASLMHHLAAQGHAVFLVGGPDDTEAVSAIRQIATDQQTIFADLYGQTKNLSQLAALILKADLLLGVDSSPLHMAVGYNKPVVAMFGPTDEKKLLPSNNPRFQAVTVPELACRPCLWDVRNENCATSDCLHVPVDAMLRAAETALSLS